jgi:hypothetical protein
VSDFLPGVAAAGAPAVVAEGAGAACSAVLQPVSAMDAKAAIISKYFMWIPQNWKAVQHMLDGNDYT